MTAFLVEDAALSLAALESWAREELQQAAGAAPPPGEEG